MARYSDAYVEHLTRGPFPGRVDPWGETGSYFPQIHSGIISHFLSQTRDSLLRMGYVASREASLHIADARSLPDVAVRQTSQKQTALPEWDYAAAARAAQTDPGMVVSLGIMEQEAIYIKWAEKGSLVTVVEIISPSNKTRPEAMLEYQERRNRLVQQEGVNVVEVDLTRSVKRLLQDVLVTLYAYHTAIYLPGALPRLIGMDFGQPLKPFALPLRGEVIAVETQAAYDYAYQQASTAAQIYNNGHYTIDELPFPSLLTPQQRQEVLQAVASWQDELKRLRDESQ